MPLTFRTCRTCPSFLAGTAQASTLGSDLNGPICGSKMLPLIMPNQPREAQDRVFRHVAKKCSKYGDDVKLTTLPADVAPPLPVGIDADAAQPTATDSQAYDASCVTCKNYISPTLVQRETGWTGSLCRATGNLMPDNRLNVYAKQCGKFVRRSVYLQQVSLDTFTFFPQFSKTFGTVDPALVYRESVEKFVDPREWINEREVPEDRRKALWARWHSRGIRAWRRITDPDGYGDPVWLPVYDVESFPKDEQELIPKTNDDEHPELYADHGQLLYTMAVLWMKLDETPAWWGQGGTGKTEFARHLAWLMCLPFHRINVTAQTDIDDIAGKMLFEDGETKFHYGRLPSAWTRPGVILLDEPNTGPPDVWQFLRPLTDNSRMLVLDQNKAERLKRHSDCFFAMAMNPAWDIRNVGAQTIGDADSSRLMHIFFGFPPESLEMEIIQRRVKLDGWEVPKDTMSAVMKVCKDLRQMSEDHILHTTWGIRHQIKVARALRWFSPVRAYRRAIGDALEPEQLAAVLTVIKSHFSD